MFTRNAGQKALVTVIRALVEGTLEEHVATLEANGLWRGGSGALSSAALVSSLTEILNDYEETVFPNPTAASSTKESFLGKPGL